MVTVITLIDAASEWSICQMKYLMIYLSSINISHILPYFLLWAWNIMQKGLYIFTVCIPYRSSHLHTPLWLLVPDVHKVENFIQYKMKKFHWES